MRLHHVLITGCALLAGLPATVFADWMLDNAQSNVNFLSVKNAAVTEIHQFRELSGSVSERGDVIVSIDLTSVDTLIPVRDERMNKMLFETELFPVATLMAQVDKAALVALKPGQTMSLEAEVDLDLHGKKQLLVANLQVVGLENGGILVNTIKPVVIDSKNFALDKGVEALQNIANLNSIATSVPVNVRLTFVQNTKKE
ncbi:YceI family protein [Photobacterium sp.]|uniref:YceI family protein n=1 Tax=Photobacterium sp. TaxID=660 RepID=UPI00299EDB40|nr:YceI family protein [Photobacterium sp.]MDX1302207.1 YceI family protein [Photobacterium sp.]